ncbi:replication protein A 70 kDa DNA-binding subunit C-like [Raphanus sativus]|nr:replication protein A 70 kDa DNA-binding subunit C-like [Raphanus sativus]
MSGVKINASVKKDLVNQFDSFLSEGSSKIFINFTVIPSGGSYRTTIHPYKIGFFSTTRVRFCDDLPIELTGFEPVNYRDILDGTLNTDYLCVAYGALAHNLNAFWPSTTEDVVVTSNMLQTYKVVLNFYLILIFQIFSSSKRNAFLKYELAAQPSLALAVCT